MLRKIFGSESGEVTGDWRKLHNKELHGCYFSPNIIRMIKSKRIRMDGSCGNYMVENKTKVLFGRLAGMGPLVKIMRK